MSLYESFAQLKFDIRMKDWNVNQNLVTEKEIKKKLESLKDMSDNVEEVSLFSTDQTQDPSNAPSEDSSSDTSDTSPPQQAVSAQDDHLNPNPPQPHNTEETNPVKTNEDPSNPWW